MNLPKVSWHLLVDPPLAGPVNMARDQGLLDLAERERVAVLRLYRWTPYCISLGRNEPALRRYDRDRIEQRGLDCVRRPTGGRAVWHARELTYAVAAPVEVFGSLREAYRQIHDMLSQALHRLGAVATLAGTPVRTAGLDAGACFASSAGGEVMVEGAKVIGSAQLQQGRAFLQHGSVLLEDTQDVIQSVTRGVPPASQDRPLASILDRSLPFEEVAEAITGSARVKWPEWQAWTAEPDLAMLVEAHLPRFSSAEWIWRR